MLVSFVLRLRSQDLERGLFTGRIEHVASGQQHAFTDLAQVEDFCVANAATPPAIPEPQRLRTSEENDPA